MPTVPDFPDAPDVATRLPDTGRTSLLLPSRGRWYTLPSGEPAVPEGRITLRRLSFDEEANLNTQGVDALQKMRQIIEAACLMPNKFSHQDLLMTDRMAVLLMLRTVTLGPNYGMTYRCRQCGQSMKLQIDIQRDLEEITPEVVESRLRDQAVLKGEEPPSLDEPWTVKLPEREAVVRVRFLRGKDEDLIHDRARRFRLQSIDPTDPSHRVRTALMIVDIDGNEMSQINKERWVRTLTMGDSVRLQNSLERRETSIDTTLYPDCRNCGAANKVKMIFDDEFFRPSDL